MFLLRLFPILPTFLPASFLFLFLCIIFLFTYYFLFLLLFHFYLKPFFSFLFSMLFVYSSDNTFISLFLLLLSFTPILFPFYYLFFIPSFYIMVSFLSFLWCLFLFSSFLVIQIIVTVSLILPSSVTIFSCVSSILRFPFFNINSVYFSTPSLLFLFLIFNLQQLLICYSVFAPTFSLLLFVHAMFFSYR